MSDVKRCSACGKEKPVAEMKTCMHNQMHSYVCDMKCMDDFYNPTKTPTASEKIAALATENAQLRAELDTLKVQRGEPASYANFRNGRFGSWLHPTAEDAKSFDKTALAGKPAGSTQVALYTAPPATDALVEALGMLDRLRGMINCTPENDAERVPVWISTKHPVIERIDALLATYRASQRKEG